MNTIAQQLRERADIEDQQARTMTSSLLRKAAVEIERLEKLKK